MLNRLEAEALHYWTHVKRLRLTSVLAADKAEAADELSLALKYSSHEGIRGRISRALAPVSLTVAK